MYFLVTAGWVVSVIVSLIYQNRKVPIAAAVLGILTQVGIWHFGLGGYGIAALAILAVVCMCTVPEVFFNK